MAHAAPTSHRSGRLVPAPVAAWCRVTGFPGEVKGQQFVASNAFNYTILFLILLNLVLLGIEVDLASGMPYGESPVPWSLHVVRMGTCEADRGFMAGKEGLALQKLKTVSVSLWVQSAPQLNPTRALKDMLLSPWLVHCSHVMHFRFTAPDCP